MDGTTADGDSQQASERVYWHGGAPGLAAGEVILPADRLRELPAAYRLFGRANYPCDPSLVYITEDRNFALAYAHAFQARMDPLTGLPTMGWLYEVKPLGTLQDDPDCPPRTGNYQVNSAVVIRVEEVHVQLSDWDMNRFMLKYTTWTDSTPCYDDKGYMLPSPEQRRNGICEADLKSRGRWVPG